MPWIRFDPREESPLCLPGSRDAAARLVIFAPPGGLAEEPWLRLAQQEVDMVMVNAGLDGAANRLPQVSDTDGSLRRRFIAGIEFDLEGQALLFVLDVDGLPYAAWFGADPAEAEVLKEALKWLEFAAIQCPE
jgi:hypothetical protein